MTARVLPAIALVIAAAVRPPIVSALNETPSSNRAVILQPFKFGLGFGDDSRYADSTLIHQGYAVERLFDVSLDAYPTSKISDFVEAIGNAPGAVVYSTHGTSGEFIVETYGLSNQAVMMANYNAYLSAGFNDTELAWYVETSPYSYCGIMITSLGVSRYFDGANSIIYASACLSGAMSNMWTGARCFLGYPNVCGYNQSLADYQAFWGRLDGSAGKIYRVVSAAVLGTTLALYKNGATVLAPSVAAIWPPAGATIECGDSACVIFDTAMDTQVDPYFAVFGSSKLRVADVAWDGADRIKFVLEPLEYGTAIVRLRSNKLASAYSPALCLDGNTNPPGYDGRGPGRDDFEWSLESSCDGDYPVAWVDGLEWRAGEVRWHAVSERGTEAYRLAGSESLSGSVWVSASEEIAAMGSGTRYALRPSRSFPFYRVEERERAGERTRWLPYMPIAAEDRPERLPAPRPLRAARRVRVIAPLRVRDSAFAYRAARARLGLETDVELTDASPEDALAALESDPTAGQPGAAVARVWGGATAPGPQTNVAPGANDLAILYAPGLDATGAVSAYAVDKEALGWNVSVVSLSSPTFATAKAKVDSLNAAGVDAILLMGAVRDGNGPGTTMPATMEPDSFTSFTDFSLRSETILTLWDYEANPANPGRVGPLVGYLPLETPSEVWVYSEKMADYEWNGKYRSNWDNFSSWGWDVGLANNSPAQVVADVESASVRVPPSWERESLWGSQVPAGSGWTQMASASLDAGQGIVLGLSTGSAPDNPCHWLNAGSGLFDPWTDLAANFKCPLFLSLSCQSTQIDAVDPDDLPVVAHELLAVPDRGIIGAIGPSRGFYEYYYALYAWTFWDLYTSGTYFFVGDLHRAVRNRLLDDAPADPMMQLFCRLTILVGDPTTTLPGVNLAAVTSVPGAENRDRAGSALWLGPPTPNPFNPRVGIAFRLDRRGLATLRVLDPSGRRVVTLVDGDLAAGAHRAEWDGRDHSRREVGSGVYLFELSAGGRRVVRRATLLR